MRLILVLAMLSPMILSVSADWGICTEIKPVAEPPKEGVWTPQPAEIEWMGESELIKDSGTSVNHVAKYGKQIKIQKKGKRIGMFPYTKTFLYHVDVTITGDEEKNLISASLLSKEGAGQQWKFNFKNNDGIMKSFWLNTNAKCYAPRIWNHPVTALSVQGRN